MRSGEKRPRAGWVTVLFLAGYCSAAVITEGPWVDAITHSTARVYWTTDVAASTYIKYGPTEAYGSTSVGSGATNGQRVHAWFFSGLAPGQLYHFAACSHDGAEVCSADQTFTTLALDPGKTHPAGPEPPSVVDTSMPTQDGAVLTVEGDCDDAATGLVARWSEAQWGDTVIIPPGMVCSGSYIFPAKEADTQVPHRWIVTRTGAADAALPPEGARIDPSYAGSMPVIQTNVTDTTMGTLASLPQNTCYAGSYFWAYDQPGFQMRQCVNLQVGAITDVAGTGSAPIVVTVANHGLSNGDLIYISGVQGNTAANGSFRVTVVDANTVQLRYIGWGSPTSNGTYQGGGVLARNVWSGVLPHVEGTAAPATCSAGDWFFKTDAGQAADGVYRCATANNYVRMPVRTVSSFGQYPAINLSNNGAHHLRFIGLNITHVPLAPEPLWSQGMGLQPGSSIFSLIHQAENNHHIVWDRCWIHGQDYPARLRRGGTFEGSDIAVINSYFNGMQMWMGPDPSPSDYESAAIVIDRGPGPGRIENNYIEAYGISLYASDDAGSHGPLPCDYEILRNTFYRSDEYMYGSPTSNGRTYVTRHLLELKRGKRWRIEGNLFDGNWASVNNAAAIALSPRPGPGVMIASIANGVVTTYSKHYLRTGNRVVITMSATAAHNGVWTVSEVADDTHFSIAGITGTGGPARANVLDNDSTISDIAVRSNVFRRVNAGISTIGHTDGASYPVVQNPVFARLLVSNNLFAELDSSRAIPNGSYPGGAGGFMLYVALGAEDVQVIHNTLYRGSTSLVALALEKQSLSVPSEGLLMRDNLLYYGGGAVAMSGTYYGTDALNRGWVAGDKPAWSFVNNLIVKQGAPPALKPFGPYPVGTLWHDLASGPVPFADPTDVNFQLTGLYKGIATDGTDPGVDMSELDRLLGTVRDLGVVGVGRSKAIVAYTAPDGGKCAIDASAGSDFKDSQRVSDGGGGRTRFVTVEGLDPSALSYYRVICGKQAGGSELRAVAAGGDAVTFSLDLQPPARAGVERAVVDYGVTEDLGSSTAPAPCAAQCTVSVPAVSGDGLFYRVRYLNAGNQLVAAGKIIMAFP